MQTIQTLALTLARAFVTANRVNGDEFCKLADGSPEWMADAIHNAHGGMMPDDTRYAMIRETAFRIADADDSEIEDSLEAIDGLVDVYTSDLTRWLASSVHRVAYCDEAANEYGAAIALDGGLVKMLQCGQLAEYSEIWSQLVAALEEEAEIQNADCIDA